MSTSQCAVYQIKDTPEYRDVCFCSYEKLKSEGRTVQIENYQQVYIGRIQPGETPADIKTRLQKQRLKNFKGHSIGCSDVIVITDDGKTTAYYVNKDGFIIIPEFFAIKSYSDTRLSIDTTGYEIEGKKGTWLAQDYILMNEKKWFLMEHEEYGTRAAYVILSEEGAVERFHRRQFIPRRFFFQRSECCIIQGKFCSVFFIKFILVAALTIIGVHIFICQILSGKMNLFIHFFELLFSIF